MDIPMDVLMDVPVEIYEKIVDGRWWLYSALLAIPDFARKVSMQSAAWQKKCGVFISPRDPNHIGITCEYPLRYEPIDSLPNRSVIVDGDGSNNFTTITVRSKTALFTVVETHCDEIIVLQTFADTRPPIPASVNLADHWPTSDSSPRPVNTLIWVDFRLRYKIMACDNYVDAFEFDDRGEITRVFVGVMRRKSDGSPQWHRDHRPAVIEVDYCSKPTPIVTLRHYNRGTACGVLQTDHLEMVKCDLPTVNVRAITQYFRPSLSKNKIKVVVRITTNPLRSPSR